VFNYVKVAFSVSKTRQAQFDGHQRPPYEPLLI